MSHNEPALDWLEKNKELALSCATFEEFCAKEPKMGPHYRTYTWMPAYFRTLKAKGYIPYRSLQQPEASKVSDLFEAAVMVRQTYEGEGKKRHSTYKAPAGYSYISNDMCGHYGGERTFRTDQYSGKPVPTHYGATWWTMYVKTKPGAMPENIFDYSCSWRAITRDDGTTLITWEASQIIASYWVAILDNVTDADWLALLPADQAEMVRREKAAEEAFSVELEKLGV